MLNLANATSLMSMDEKKALSQNTGMKIVIAIVVGIVMRLFGASLNQQSNPSLLLAGGVLLIQIAAIVLFCLGCGDYAKSKGYSPALGLVGLIGCIGLIILAVLPDKWKPKPGPMASDSNYTRDPNRL
jgi:hypothetical protein